MTHEGVTLTHEWKRWKTRKTREEPGIEGKSRDIEPLRLSLLLPCWSLRFKGSEETAEIANSELSLVSKLNSFIPSIG